MPNKNENEGLTFNFGCLKIELGRQEIHFGGQEDDFAGQNGGVDRQNYFYICF